MSGLKIVVIGGGSSYTPELIEGLLNRYHEMPVASLWLVDIEEGKRESRDYRRTGAANDRQSRADY
ncbi:hypothetical protein LNQ52_27310 [Klebsiella pneumoniae subsp. pneumoniae]|nr:hypothetical protein [Klebsiella pneumoniae subsp. pneumoniae]